MCRGMGIVWPIGFGWSRTHLDRTARIVVSGLGIALLGLRTLDWTEVIPAVSARLHVMEIL
jgi:hypothetical protein